MKPGQILFYQSAKLVHGRPKPFAGDRFVNCFCHFKPAVRPGAGASAGGGNTSGSGIGFEPSSPAAITRASG
jgi:hypothetical protein